MATLITLTEAQKHLPELLDKVDQGEEILIKRDGRPSMKLASVENKTSGPWRVSGRTSSKLTTSPPTSTNQGPAAVGDCDGRFRADNLEIQPTFRIQRNPRSMKLAHMFLAMMTLVGPAYAGEDKAASFQMGTYISTSVAADGTITSTLHGDGTTVAGSVHENQLAIYSLKVADGVWKLETYTQNKDSMIRQMGMTPMHLKVEKDNPLDVLKGGERVLFRAEKHKKLNGIETSVYIPFAGNPNKEFRFIGYFYPDAQQLQPQKPSDNVKAMCDAHKLSPELEKLYCVEQPRDAASTPIVQNLVPSSTDAQLPAATTQFSDADRRTAANLDKLSCAQINTIISNPQLATYLPLTWKTAHEKCKQ